LSGYKLSVRLPAGTSSTELAKHAEEIAVAMRVADVRVERDKGKASRVDVSVICRDALAGPPVPWPLSGSERFNLWEPVPVGVDEDGSPVTLSLPERNVLIGGEPGAGKSVAMSLLIAAAALDPAVTLWLLDGKRVELAPWEGCAARLVGPDIGEATNLLDELRAEMERRYSLLLASGKRKIAPGEGLGLHVLAVDELAFYTATGDKRARDRFSESLRDLVARGRGAGIIVLAATQRPSSGIVSTDLRDLFTFRWAMRCSTRDSSDTILGAGWATEGYSAATIDPANRGVGYLLHEGGKPVRLRAYYLDDAAVTALADRASFLRQGDWR
jgi:DNA segregation ATPase FtsK/SpoIIIE-like protein